MTELSNSSLTARGIWTLAGVGFVLGCLLQLQQADLNPREVYAALCLVSALAGVSLRLKPSAVPGTGWAGAIAALAIAATLGFGWVGWRACSVAQAGLEPRWEGPDLRVRGVVAAMPQRNEAGLRFRLEVESATLNGTTVHLPQALMLGWYNGLGSNFDAGDPFAELQRQPAELRAGERWDLTVRLKAGHGNLNPHGFDYELWLWEQGVLATGYVRAGPRDAEPVLREQTWEHPVEWARQWVRDAIFERVPDRQQAGLIAALVVGDQNAIERADWDVYRATGVAHLMSISGLHVTMFAWGAAWVVGWAWRRSTRLCLWLPAGSAAVMGAIGLASAYALFSGWGVPSQRTVWMLTTVSLLKLGGWRWPWPQVWLAAMVVIVGADPWALLQAGFWLSFVAVGILFATDAPAPLQAGSVLGARLRAMFREQWVVTVALAPLSLLLFNQVSLVGLLANALAIPWVTLVLTPVSMLGVLWPPLWDIAAWAVWLMNQVLQALARVPLATVSVAVAPLWAAVLGVAGASLLVLPWPRGVRLLGLPLVLPVLLWQAPRPAPGHFELLAADIGQGNAVLVRTATHALMYDAGPRLSSESDAGHRVLVPLLTALAEQVDTLVLSHRDTDHTGGAPAVLAMQQQALLLSSIAVTHPLQSQRPAQRCVAGQHWEWDGVQFEILRPQMPDYEANLRPNAMSCVLRISAGLKRALLVGDIEHAQEALLVAAIGDLRADVLLVPHHGSKTSSSEAFLDAVHPRIAIVQAGYRNRFGHPAGTIMERYHERGIEVFDSPHCGALLWSTESPEVVRCQRRLNQRYWHHKFAVETNAGPSTRR